MNNKDDRGFTPLMSASIAGQLDVLNALIAAGEMDHKLLCLVKSPAIDFLALFPENKLTPRVVFVASTLECNHNCHTAPKASSDSTASTPSAIPLVFAS